MREKGGKKKAHALLIDGQFFLSHKVKKQVTTGKPEAALGLHIA